MSNSITYAHQRKIHHQSAAYHRKIKKKLFDRMGGQCIKCGFSDYRVLQVDHINGRGKKDRLGTHQLYLHILKDNLWKEKYQLLCANCNQIKRWEKEENCINSPLFSLSTYQTMAKYLGV
jgi:hypothetical protein